MIDKRLILVLAAAGLLAACGDDAGDETAQAPNEVLEGTISDAMLPLDRVRSQAPLEDPEAFAAAQSQANATTTRAAAPTQSADEADYAAESEAETETEEDAGEAAADEAAEAE